LSVAGSTRARILLREWDGRSTAGRDRQPGELQVEAEGFPVGVGTHATHEIWDAGCAWILEDVCEGKLADIVAARSRRRAADDVGGGWWAGPVS